MIEKRKKFIFFFPHSNLPVFDSPLTSRVRVCVCVVLCVLHRGLTIGFMTCVFHEINCGCVPLRWRVPQFTSSTNLTPVSPERGIFRPPPRSHLGETHANVARQCVGSATRCGHQLRVKPKVHEDGLRYSA